MGDQVSAKEKARRRDEDRGLTSLYLKLARTIGKQFMEGGGSPPGFNVGGVKKKPVFNPLTRSPEGQNFEDMLGQVNRLRRTRGEGVITAGPPGTGARSNAERWMVDNFMNMMLPIRSEEEREKRKSDTRETRRAREALIRLMGEGQEMATSKEEDEE